MDSINKTEELVVCFQWDQGLLTMSVGEKAEFTIEPEWAYGKKGVEGKYPLANNGWNSHLAGALQLLLNHLICD